MSRTLLAVVFALYSFASLTTGLPLFNGIVAQTEEAQPTPPEAEKLVNEIEVTKEAALYIEDFLEMMKGKAEDSFIRGDITKELWEDYQFLHGDTMHFHHLLVVATLFYEEAPNDTHAELLATFARDLAERILRLEWFCQNYGIEITPLGELVI